METPSFLADYCKALTYQVKGQEKEIASLAAKVEELETAVVQKQTESDAAQQRANNTIRNQAADIARLKGEVEKLRQREEASRQPHTFRSRISLDSQSSNLSLDSVAARPAASPGEGIRRKSLGVARGSVSSQGPDLCEANIWTNVLRSKYPDFVVSKLNRNSNMVKKKVYRFCDEHSLTKVFGPNKSRIIPQRLHAALLENVGDLMSSSEQSSDSDGEETRQTAKRRRSSGGGVSRDVEEENEYEEELMEEGAAATFPCLVPGCSSFGMSQKSKDSLMDHQRAYHSPQVSVELPGRHEPLVVPRLNGLFKCPTCSKNTRDAFEFKRHVNGCTATSETKGESTPITGREPLQFTDILYNMVPEYAQVSDELKDAIRNGVEMFLNAVSEEYGIEASFRVDLGNGESTFVVPEEVVEDFVGWVFPELQRILPSMEVREWER
ncbi:hypothetical protein HDU98_006334 [Podochytrium sp. JEL0797]|nr:hypothetical protein HDU98_006334 [Podochytrium sp. JEL0797]